MQAQLDVVKRTETIPGLDRDLSVDEDGAFRYQYSKRGYACLKFVIVDVGADGQEEFWEQEAGEVCWHSFYPCAAERAAFHEFIAARENGGWPLLVLSPAAKDRSTTKFNVGSCSGE